MSRKIFSIICLVCYVVNTSAQDTTTLAEVVITGNKYPVKQNETGKVITVINQQQLQKSYGKTLPELLNEQLGITINGATNSPGTNLLLFVRGAAPGNTLILIDGVPLNDASGTSSEFDLNNFSLYTIDRIEILKGSQSTLYGSDAVAGVINIITKKSAVRGVVLNAIASAGSYGTYKAALSLSGKINGVEYFLGFNKFISKGLSAAYDSTGKDDFEKDPFRQQLFQANIGGKLFKQLHARVYGKMNSNRTDIDAGAFTDDEDYRLKNRNIIAGTNLVYTFPLGTLNFNYNYNWYKRYFKDDSGHVGGINSPTFFYSIFQEGNFKSRSQFAEFYFNCKLQKHLKLLAGTDFRKNASDQSYFSISNFGPFSSVPLSSDSVDTRQFSGYASLLFNNLSGGNVELGGRWNHHSVYGNNVTYSFSGSNSFDSFRVFANVSSGFRAPSLYQLYSEFGNKDLQPEESVSYEAGLEFKDNDFTTRIVGFHRKIKDVFVFYTDPATFASKYINDDLQKDHGVEFEAGYTVPGRYFVNANYTFVTGKITTANGPGKDTTYFNLYRRPKHSINFNAGFDITRSWLVQAGVQAVSKFFEPVYGGAPIEMKGYYTVNLYSEYTVNKTLKLFADLRNITNNKYFEARGFNSKRFNVNGGIILAF